MARDFYTDREKMTLVSEKDGVISRTAEKGDGMLSLSEMVVADINPSDVKALAYNLDNLISQLNKKVTYEKVKEEGPFLTVL